MTVVNGYYAELLHYLTEAGDFIEYCPIAQQQTVGS